MTQIDVLDYENLRNQLYKKVDFLEAEAEQAKKSKNWTKYERILAKIDTIFEVLDLVLDNLHTTYDFD